MNEEAVVVVHDDRALLREGTVIQGERKAALSKFPAGLVVLPVSPRRLASTLASMAAGSYVRRALCAFQVLPGHDHAPLRVSTLAPVNLYFDAGEQRVHLALGLRVMSLATNGSLRLSSRGSGLAVQPGEPIELGRIPDGSTVVLRHEARAVADAPGLATVALSGLIQGVELLWVAATVLGQ